MKSLDTNFTIEVKIDLPREIAVALFSDTENYSIWQPNLISFEITERFPSGKIESMDYKCLLNGEVVDVKRIVLEADTPNMNVVTYEIQGLRCLMENHFTILDDNHCKWVANINIISRNKFYDNEVNMMAEAYKQYFVSIQSSFKKYAESV